MAKTHPTLGFASHAWRGFRKGHPTGGNAGLAGDFLGAVAIAYDDFGRSARSIKQCPRVVEVQTLESLVVK
jgi:hypothetical protein